MTPSRSASARARSSTSGPRPVLSSSAWAGMRASAPASIRWRVSVVSGQWRLITSQPASSSSSPTVETSRPGACGSRPSRATVAIDMPKPCWARRATARPILPKPMMPNRAPVTSVPIGSCCRVHPRKRPSRTWRSPSGTRRATARSSAIVRSAVASVSESGVLVTVTPWAAAAARSMLSTPAAMLATTDSWGLAANTPSLT